MRQACSFTTVRDYSPEGGHRQVPDSCERLAVAKCVDCGLDYCESHLNDTLICANCHGFQELKGTTITDLESMVERHAGADMTPIVEKKVPTWADWDKFIFGG